MNKEQYGTTRYYVAPADTDKSPLVIHLHGTGEKSDTSLDLVLRYGPVGMIDKGIAIPMEATFVQPQLGKNRGKWDINEVEDLILHCLEKYNADENAIHGMGVSLGGLGMREYLASQYGPQLASCTLMSPGGGPWSSQQINAIGNAGVPLWISHARNDVKIPGALFKTSEAAFYALQQVVAGRTFLHFTSMGLSGHSPGSAWGRFMTPTNYYLWEWMRAQRKGPENADIKIAVKEYLQNLINTL